MREVEGEGITPKKLNGKRMLEKVPCRKCDDEQTKDGKSKNLIERESCSKIKEQSLKQKTKLTFPRYPLSCFKSQKIVRRKIIRCDWMSWLRSARKRNHFVIKLGVIALLLGLALRLLVDRSSGFSPVSDYPFLENGRSSATSVVSLGFRGDQATPQEYSQQSKDSEEGECNLFIGDWMPCKAKPFYTNKTCSFIEDHQNCMKNGRSDTGYLYWRWKPRGCELHQFESKRFLEMMRNKSWAFIGDSISRNHVQSFLCMLSVVENPVEVYHDENYKSRRWFFPVHNFTVSVIWTPFLAKAAIFEDVNGVSTSEIELHLDMLDKSWTEEYKTLDYMIISSGKWFFKTAIYYEKNTILGCHYCPKLNLTELGFNFAFRKVIRNVFNYIIESNHKGMIFYRTSTPDHFEGGEWFNEGTCKRTAPAKEGEMELSELNRILHELELEEFEKASVKASENGVNLRLFDGTPLSLLRPDGHPGPYRFFQPFAKGNQQKVIYDCLHWCLPGPIDSWNDLLMEMVVHG